MKTSSNALQKLKRLEGFRSKAYLCPAKVWTIGYGFTDGVREGDTITQTEAGARLILELAKYEQAVFEVTGGNVNQNQFDALVLFAFNVGIAGMRGSSVIKAHNRGDFTAAARAFGLWNKGGGKVLAGLVQRRAEEAALYLTPVGDFHDTPQAVDAPKPMTSSTTVIAGSTAAMATATQVIDQVVTIKSSVSGLGSWMAPTFAVIALVAIGYIIYERFMQRERGNA